jgi:hypothetical protein
MEGNSVNEFERFHQGIFDQLEELERVHRQRIVSQFVELGSRFRVNVIAEILDNGKTASEVFDAINRAQSQN